MHNEAENVAPLYAELRDALDGLGQSYELVFVDDGSDDDTLSELLALPRGDVELCIVELRSRYGQTAALTAGTKQAAGEVIVAIDGDLQNDPHDIPRLVNKLNEGYDLVLGWRKDRKDPFLTRTIPSMIANFALAGMTGVKVHDSGCSLKAMRASLLDRISLYSDMHRFLPALSSLATHRISELPVRHVPRRAGRSKYGLSRTWSVMLDLLTLRLIVLSSRRPLRWFGSWAVLFLCVAVLSASALVARAMVAGSPTSPLSWEIALVFLCLAAHAATVGLLAQFATAASSETAVRPLVRQWQNPRTESLNRDSLD